MVPSGGICDTYFTSDMVGRAQARASTARGDAGSLANGSLYSNGGPGRCGGFDCREGERHPLSTRAHRTPTDAHGAAAIQPYEHAHAHTNPGADAHRDPGADRNPCQIPDTFRNASFPGGQGGTGGCDGGAGSL